VVATARSAERGDDALHVRIADDARLAHFKATSEPYDPALQFYVQANA